MTIRTTKKQRAATPEHEKRFYELWRLWLLETDESEWDDSDGGDFKEEQKQVISMEFDQWWAKNNHRAIDKGYTEYAFVPIKTVDDFHEYDGCEEFGEIIFKIAFDTPKHILHKELDKLIALHHRNHQSGHEADYFLSGIESIEWTRKPTKRTVEAVERIYKVYTTARKMRAKNPKVFLYEIGAAAGLRSKWNESVRQHTAAVVGHSEKELMSTTTRHYLDYAEDIKAGLNKGIFPYFNIKKAPRR